MTDYPDFWDTILSRLGLTTFAGIENIVKVLTFLGYTTAASIAKLRKPKELNLFQIEVAKLDTNVNFCNTYPELKQWRLNHGTIEILKDISNAAGLSLCSGDDLESIREKVFERCKKVSPNLIESNVMTNFDNKPSCEIICPFDSCRQVTKLSLIKQTNLLQRPNFNIYNFERHINTQHTNKKRKQDMELCEVQTKQVASDTINSVVSCEISNSMNADLPSLNDFFSTSSSTPTRKPPGNQSQLVTPKTANILDLRKRLDEANSRIQALESIQISASSPSSSSSSSSSSTTPSSYPPITPKSARIEKLSEDLIATEKVSCELQKENILLRHKCMDARGHIRTFCRIKPDETGNVFNWQSDSEKLKISSDVYSLDYIFKPEHTNKYVFGFIEPLIFSVLEGFNVCIICYGASGSGKSTTMIGLGGDEGGERDYGLIPRSVDYLMKIMPGHYEFEAQFCEVYNECFVDLLNENSQVKPGICETGHENGVKIHKVANLNSITVESVAEFDQMLMKAVDRRTVAETGRNKNSSRSHFVTQIGIKGKFANDSNKTINSNLFFFDLAGSENDNDRLVGGQATQSETRNINKSITHFHTVIESLKRKELAPDFRSAKLTHLLKTSLTTNTKTAMIVTVSQETKYLSASKAALAIAQSASQIKINDVKRNMTRL